MSKRTLYISTCLLAVLGLVLGLWPLGATAVVLAGVSGYAVLALVVGIVLDVVWGPAQGWAAHVYAPFVLLGLACVLLNTLLRGYFLTGGPPDTL